MASRRASRRRRLLASMLVHCFSACMRRLSSCARSACDSSRQASKSRHACFCSSKWTCPAGGMMRSAISLALSFVRIVSRMEDSFSSCISPTARRWSSKSMLATCSLAILCKIYDQFGIRNHNQIISTNNHSIIISSSSRVAKIKIRFHLFDCRILA